MGRNARGSEGYSMPRAKRPRRGVEITLAPEELAALELVAEARGLSKARAVGELALEAAATLRKSSANRRSKQSTRG